MLRFEIEVEGIAMKGETHSSAADDSTADLGNRLDRRGFDIAARVEEFVRRDKLSFGSVAGIHGTTRASDLELSCPA